MKSIPSFFICILVLLFLGCDRSAGTSGKVVGSLQDSIKNLVRESHGRVIGDREQLRFLKRAYKLAEESNDKPMQFYVLSNTWYFTQQYALDSIEFYWPLLMRLANETQDPTHLAYCYSSKADYLRGNVTAYDSAYFYYIKARTFYEKGKDSLGLGHALLRMAQIHHYYDDYAGGEELLTESLLFLNSKKGKRYLKEVYNLLGNTYSRFNELDISNDFFLKALDISDDSLAQAVIQYNIIDNNYKKGQKTESIINLNQLLGQDHVVNDKPTQAMMMGRLGRYLLAEKDMRGVSLIKKSDSLSVKYGLPRFIALNNIALSDYYREMDVEKSRNAAQRALQYADSIKQIHSKQEALKRLISLSDGKSLKEFSEQYILVQDSIAKVRQRTKNQFAKMRYDFEQERNQRLEYQAESVGKALDLEKQKRKGTLYLIVIIVLFGAVLIIYFVQAYRSKQRAMRDVYLTETRIAKKLHDELANDIYNVIAYTEAQELSDPLHRNQILKNLDVIYTRTRNISQEHSVIDTDTGFADQLRGMLRGYQSEKVKITLLNFEQIDWGRIDEYKKVTAYRILQELMVNMKKHSRCSLVLLSFYNQDKKIRISYSDNGIGLVDGGVFLKNGLQHVENRMETIGGSVIFENEPGKGFRVRVEFPV